MLLSNGWTGAQYSLFRMVFGASLAVHFAQRLPWGRELASNAGVPADGSTSPFLHLFPNVLAVADSPVVVTTLLIVAVLAAVCFAVGLHDRLAAVAMWCVLACTFGRNPLVANPVLPFVGWLLVAHACLPPAPFGSWQGRGALDAGASWRMPAAIFTATWVLMALGYSYSGYTKLVNPWWVDGTAIQRVLMSPLARPGWSLGLPPIALHLATWSALALQLVFAPLAIVRTVRPWLWAAMLAMQLPLTTLVDFADLGLGMVMLHLFTFDPAWVRPRAGAPATIFYDGHCGVCHGFVRWVISEDRAGTTFRFAPLGGAAYHATFSEAERRDLPDSVIVRGGDGRLLTRSAAALHVAERLGGAWRVLAVLLEMVPLGLRDRVYDGVARVRRSIFKAPTDTCPVLPRELRLRFDA